ncbi:MAG: NAD-dependent dehydratase [Flavobacteriales bacterium]|nr:NAD-dependent dehydratase [Flavobacteriales bacterium]|tara:strand:- start:598 stop:1506 length:909 start_codon:yes stop_codon:yes gene_type:complete
MDKVLVTGGAGFIGSNLVDVLIKKGVDVVIIDNLSTGKLKNINPKANFLKYDLSTIDISELINILDGVEFIFHLAALARVQPSIEDPIPYHHANVTSTLNILYAASKSKVKRIIYSASSSCYGDSDKVPQAEDDETNPLSPYGLQKYIGEQYCSMFSQVYNLDTVSLRYFNVYGERMNLDGAYCLVTGIFARQMLNNQPLTITNDGNQRRDFTYVGDVVDANILAAQHPANLNGMVFNIGNGQNFSINNVADMFGGDKQYGEKRLEPFETLADNSKAKKILKWTPKGDLKKWIKNYKIELGI